MFKAAVEDDITESRSQIESSHDKCAALKSTFQLVLCHCHYSGSVSDCSSIPQSDTTLCSVIKVNLMCVSVIDGLDRLKKENAGARDGIRFLESEFRKGNRWVFLSRLTTDGALCRSFSERCGFIWAYHKSLSSSCRYIRCQKESGRSFERDKLKRQDIEAW